MEELNLINDFMTNNNVSYASYQFNLSYNSIDEDIISEFGSEGRSLLIRVPQDVKFKNDNVFIGFIATPLLLDEYPFIKKLWEDTIKNYGDQLETRLINIFPNGWEFYRDQFDSLFQDGECEVGKWTYLEISMNNKK